MTTQKGNGRKIMEKEFNKTGQLEQYLLDQQTLIVHIGDEDKII